MYYVIILLFHEFYSGKVKHFENYILWFDNWRRVMKLSKFTNLIRKENVYLLHNALTDSVLRVNSSDLQKLIDNLCSQRHLEDEVVDQSEFLMTLKKLNFIVCDEEDEDATLNSSFFHFEHSAELYVMLIVTRRCNFRCTYCYEETEMRDMSPDIWRNALDFVINQIHEKHFQNVYISFFGGEPTLMSKEILQFMQKLNYESAMMTTNGYLLSEEMITSFVKNRIVRYQITVDGLAESHDKSRYLANGQGTWRAIINNLKLFEKIEDASVSVLIRSNITPESYANIDEWLKYLYENFSDPKYKFHFEAAKNYGKMNDDNYPLIDDESATIVDVIKRAKRWKLPLEVIGFGTTPFSAVCYAARQFSFIIDCNGEVKKCTSASLDEPYNSIGRLSSDGMEIDFKKAAQWTSYDLDEQCKTCDILPICYMRKCPASRGNYDNCDFLRRSYYSGLEYFYLD